MRETLPTRRPLLLAALAFFAVTPTASFAQNQAGELKLEPCGLPGQPKNWRCGTYTVNENRAARAGRTIDLNIVVLPAKSEDRRPDPIFFLSGGPGGAATRTARGRSFGWYGVDRDIVLVDQRGTGRSNPLFCDTPGSDEDVQGYLDPLFTPDVFEPCRERLEHVADLTQYTTPIAMDDLNEVRAALGYDVINLWGGSYGTRAALVYMRRHPETVRAAILNGVAPIAFRNPLYHAWEAQRALEKTFGECEADDACSAAFPDLREEFRQLIASLEDEPATVTIPHPATNEPVSVRLTRYAFAEALRTTMYYLPAARDVPLLIHRAYNGDFDVFAREGIASNRGIVESLAFGMLLSVTCPEDLARIDPAEIPALTAGTFLGDDRVRNQLAACSIWPNGAVPADYGDPVSVETPTLLLSGTLDPVTSPRWGAEAAGQLPNSVHIVVPGAHGVRGGCVTGIIQQFLASASTDAVDASCVESVRLAPFRTEEGNR
jgi:pimeloyl-ACP methyl ester carboxylesterase